MGETSGWCPAPARLRELVFSRRRLGSKCRRLLAESPVHMIPGREGAPRIAVDDDSHFCGKVRTWGRGLIVDGCCYGRTPTASLLVIPCCRGGSAAILAESVCG